MAWLGNIDPTQTHGSRIPREKLRSRTSLLALSVLWLTNNFASFPPISALRCIQFFAMYNTLLLSTNYVTKRQSLKLLGEILLDRANFNVMTKYISVEANLKMMMNLLRDKSRNIQFEAFHVFKVRTST